MVGWFWRQATQPPKNTCCWLGRGASKVCRCCSRIPPANAPQVGEAVQLGAFMEMNASGIYKTEAGSKAAAETVKRIGAEHIIWGQTAARPLTCTLPTASCWRPEGCVRM